jgi:hypothetical protein
MWFLSLALAQHVDTVAEDVIILDDLPWEASAIGNPSLVHDGTEFTVLFEAQVEQAGCEEAFLIGMATSPDGVSWTISPDPIVQPGAAYPCGLRDPAVAKTRQGWFVLTEDPVNGDYVMSRFKRGRWQSRPVVGLEGLRSVSFARWDGEWYATGVDPVDGLVTAQSFDAVTWALNAPVLTHGAAWWATDDVLSPSLTCHDDPLMPWTMHIGGRSGDNIGFTYAFSADMNLWFYDLAVDVADASDAWQSWDAVVEGSRAWVVTARDGSLAWASTDATLPVDPPGRDCSP